MPDGALVDHPDDVTRSARPSPVASKSWRRGRPLPDAFLESFDALRTGKLGGARRTCAAMFRLVSLALALALALSAAALASKVALAGDLALERCRLTADMLPAAFARCGKLAVPEDPAAPGG